eukprot:m.91666 g.91666  ORF g.91666 m.91666 type:complete len:274 (-) comp51148_c0_seq25:384-1205(-)
MMLVMWLIVLGVGVVQLPFLADLFGGSRWTDTRTSRALVLLVAALCSGWAPQFLRTSSSPPLIVMTLPCYWQRLWPSSISPSFRQLSTPLDRTRSFGGSRGSTLLPSLYYGQTPSTTTQRLSWSCRAPSVLRSRQQSRPTRVDRSKSIKMMTMMTRLKYLLPPLPAFASDASAENRPEFITVECASAVLTLIIVRIANSLLISRFSFFILMGSSLSLLLSRTLSLVLRLPLHRQLRWQRKLCLLFSISCACERRPDFGHGDDCQSFHQVLGHL